MKWGSIAGQAAVALGCTVLTAACVIDSEPRYLGTCLPTDPLPLYLWVGPTDKAPACLASALVSAFEGYADPAPGALTCPRCTCSGSKTTCPPPTEWSAVPHPCSRPPGADGLFFGAPSGWNGVCDTQTKIAAGLECGAGQPCAQSMWVARPDAAAEPCTASTATAGEPSGEDPAWSWGTTAVGCIDDDHEYCEDGSLYITHVPDGFRLCVESEGATCPLRFTEQVTVYLDAEDTRTCTACTCGPPEGNACSFEVSAHGDDACGAEAGGAVVSSDAPGGSGEQSVCFDLPDGAALGSKKATLTSAAPGTCTPGGGEPAGALVPVKPVTFCCRPQ